MRRARVRLVSVAGQAADSWPGRQLAGKQDEFFEKQKIKTEKNALTGGIANRRHREATVHRSDDAWKSNIWQSRGREENRRKAQLNRILRSPPTGRRQKTRNGRSTAKLHTYEHYGQYTERKQVRRRRVVRLCRPRMLPKRHGIIAV